MALENRGFGFLGYGLAPPSPEADEDSLTPEERRVLRRRAYHILCFHIYCNSTYWRGGELL